MELFESLFCRGRAEVLVTVEFLLRWKSTSKRILIWFHSVGSYLVSLTSLEDGSASYGSPSSHIKDGGGEGRESSHFLLFSSPLPPFFLHSKVKERKEGQMDEIDLPPPFSLSPPGTLPFLPFLPPSFQRNKEQKEGFPPGTLKGR